MTRTANVQKQVSETIRVMREAGWDVKEDGSDGVVQATFDADKWYATPIWLTVAYQPTRFGVASIYSPANSARPAIDRKLHSWREVRREARIYGRA